MAYYVTVLFFVRDGLFSKPLSFNNNYYIFPAVFLLFLPLLFTLGWMPQFDTFFITILEHIDVHVFGGTGRSHD